jgi:hypothetical protein
VADRVVASMPCIRIDTAKRIARVKRAGPIRRPQNLNESSRLTVRPTTGSAFCHPLIDAAITLLCIATMNYCNATSDV